MDSQVEAMAGAAPEATKIPESEIQVLPRPSVSDAAKDWLCASCLNRVASDQDRFHYDGKSEFTFRNPQGIQFDILTFSRTLGCESTGTPTQEHTWFPGHAWCFCVCDRCGTHLGWPYTGPSEFAALIRERIVRALLVRN
ncbi:MAG: hypothetical protein FJ398_18085 [Verrucomicrobia bacterium]|nr:hypothetical protein [Verrucomicrobiota bacterium]